MSNTFKDNRINFTKKDNKKRIIKTKQEESVKRWIRSHQQDLKIIEDFASF